MFILILMMFVIVLSAATAAEVCAAKDVAAMAYYDYLSIVDMKTGAEAIVFNEAGVIDYQWDKLGKNLYAITSVNIPGPDYDSPSRDEVRLYEVALPAGKSTLLKTIKVSAPDDYQYYSFANLYLDKSGNPVVVLCFGISDSKYLQYTYNPTTKGLSAPAKKAFSNYHDGYRRNSQAAILTDGKYYSKNENYRMNLYTLNADGWETAVTDLKTMKYGSSAMDEPLRYSVAQDSSFILVSYRWDEELSLGSMYAISTNDYKAILLSDDEYLGDSFIPLFTSEGKIPFYQPIENFENEIMPALKCVGKDGVVSVLKEWERNNDAPLSMRFRAK